MYYGVQYYPEHWPESRWAIDAKMMQQAGLNCVRMGEFAWSFFEPEEGALDFSPYDRIIAMLHEHGIRTIMCTCSRTVPPWLLQKHPDILTTNQNGSINPPGHRYLAGMVHPDFIRESQRIDRAIIEHFAGNPGIEAWQIDNEIGSGNDCFCDLCVAAFQEYLHDKHESIGHLNKALGEHFWSDFYSEFTEIPRPSSQPQLNLEYRRFMSKLNCDFNRWRTDLIRTRDPGKWITTNFQSIHAQHTDYRTLGTDLDINGMNHYPFRSPELILDYYRNGNKPLIVLEQFTRLLEVDAGEGRMRLWAYMALAHGCCGINFFRWRTCRWGQEQFADGILPHSGTKNRLYHELSRMGKELQQIGARIDATRPEARVAVTFGYDTRWGTKLIQSKAAQVDCTREAIRVHDSLTRQNVTTDALDPREDLSKYALLIAPRLFLVDDETAANLRNYVRNGGIICLTAHSGVVDEYGKSFDLPRPGPFADMTGIEVHDMALLDRPFLLSSPIISGLNGTHGTVMADEIHSTGADVLATWADGWRKDRPALTVNSYGKGRVFYLGTVIDGEAMDALTAHLCAAAGISPLMETPPGVRAYERQGKDERLIFILNHTEESHHISLPFPCKDAFTGEEVTSVDIGPVDLRIVSNKS